MTPPPSSGKPACAVSWAGLGLAWPGLAFCLPACLPACVPARLSTRLPTRLPSLPACLPPCLPASLPASLPPCPAPCLLACHTRLLAWLTQLARLPACLPDHKLITLLHSSDPGLENSSTGRDQRWDGHGHLGNDHQRSIKQNSRADSSCSSGASHPAKSRASEAVIQSGHPGTQRASDLASRPASQRAAGLGGLEEGRVALMLKALQGGPRHDLHAEDVQADLPTPLTQQAKASEQ